MRTTCVVNILKHVTNENIETTNTIVGVRKRTSAPSERPSSFHRCQQQVIMAAAAADDATAEQSEEEEGEEPM